MSLERRGPVWSNGTMAEGTILGRAAGGNVGALTPAQAGIPSAADYRAAWGHPSSGFDTFPRIHATLQQTPTSSGYLMLTGFSTLTSQPFTQMSMHTGSTAAGATPTVCRFGIYTVSDDLASGTLVAAIANDTALFAAANTMYTRSLDTGGGLPESYTCVPGVRYALGLVVVSAAAMPNFVCAGLGTMSAVHGLSPALAAHKSGQTGLPASFTSASANTKIFYGRAS